MDSDFWRPYIVFRNRFLYGLMFVYIYVYIYIYIYMYIYIYISRCHGNVRINDDSKSHRIIPIAWRVTINPIYVRGGQSARADKSHIHTLRAECA